MTCKTRAGFIRRVYAAILTFFFFPPFKAASIICVVMYLPFMISYF
jgi:hypothetical protein